MNNGFSAQIHLVDEAATSRLGERIAPLLRPGDTLLLEGPIGAGKTHFARAVIQSRIARSGRCEDVPSPTYTLVQVYSDGNTEIWHADLYRLTHADEVVELGLDDALADAIVLIEWPERLGDARPANALTLHFNLLAKGRDLMLSSRDSRWAKIAPSLREVA
jgi:tRNA threonylcarbamoyladenosine biosynthesis protein TsaE